jgi:hypothetical protein
MIHTGREMMSDNCKSSKHQGQELSVAELDAASGGRGNEPVKVPAKVTIPDLKLAILY